jgi:hypothetical protein
MITRLGYLADLSPACRTHDQLPRLYQLSNYSRSTQYPRSHDVSTIDLNDVDTMLQSGYYDYMMRRWHVRLRNVTTYQASIKISL